MRLIAQEILERHLNPLAEEGLFWEHSRLNLRNAYLDAVDFSGCHITCADFLGATSFGATAFRGANFPGFAVFKGATFSSSTDFLGANFPDYANFEDVAFLGFVDFKGATFSGGAEIGFATFSGIPLFAKTEFRGRFLGEHTDLVDRIEGQDVLLTFANGHFLPDGWSVEPSPVKDGFGHLRRTATD
ncbi:pentapeptide repeat-containing protein [Glycomyces buryatensis]|uniref:Pentapeptide repeat-containing protein n=1 Tax=Glycomyces buryatensis TaxID=2570927 RepID=A0A4S8QD07_9ACTN|nr:pentapeptide repeat-containing protein [Glycomyces buryatensis]THV40932.1 pentapeptide repeat-containing protein [Glycomyces buryatensis]